MLTRRSLAVVSAACAAGLALPASGAAHTPIRSLSPPAGGTAGKRLSAVRVTFAARVPDATLAVRDARGTQVSRGRGTPSDHRHAVRVRLRSGLRAGRYRATVRWLSADGHVQTRRWSFRLR